MGTRCARGGVGHALGWWLLWHVREPYVFLHAPGWQVCGTFKSTYFEYKAKASVQCCENPWKVQNSALFGRLDRFLERCHDVRELAEVGITDACNTVVTTAVAG